MEPGTLLSGYLAAGARRPFVWGVCDCCLWAAGWVELVRGVDPAGCLRGAYASQAEAAELIAAAGGLEVLLRRLAAEAGLVETADPRTGDLALVRHATAGPALAICTPRGHALKAPRGVALHPLPVLAAWSV